MSTQRALGGASQGDAGQGRKEVSVPSDPFGLVCDVLCCVSCTVCLPVPWGGLNVISCVIMRVIA